MGINGPNPRFKEGSLRSSPPELGEGVAGGRDDILRWESVGGCQRRCGGDGGVVRWNCGGARLRRGVERWWQCGSSGAR